MAQLVAEVYAQALFDVAMELDQLDPIHEAYTQVSEMLIANPELMSLLKSPRLEKDSKKDILKTIFGQSVQAELLNLFMVLVDKRRTSEILNIYDAFLVKWRAHYKIEKAIVRTVEPLTDAQKVALAEKLGQVTGLTISVENVLDASVIGGMLIQIGDQVLDGSLRRKMGSLKEALSQFAM